MQSLHPKSLLAGIFFLMMMFGLQSTASAQLLGTYFYGDSALFCVNVQGNAYAGWSGAAGTYVTGDTMDISVNWGDGNIDAYPNNIITVSGGYAYIAGINLPHTYASSGTFYVSVTAHDHYGFTQTINDSVLVDNYCGQIMGNVLLDNGNGIYEPGVDMYATGVPMAVTTSLNNYGTITGSWGYYFIDNVDQAATTYHVEVDPAWLTANGFTVMDPVAGSYDFTTPPLTYNNYNFLLNCGSTYADASISGYGWGFMPGTSTGFTYLVISNFTCDGTPANVNLSVTFDPMLTVASSNIPGYTVTGNTLTATISGITDWSYYEIHYTVPPGTPASTPLVFDLDAAVTNYTDSYMANNHFVFNSEVHNSWDPNDKSTNLAPAIDANATEEIYYNIRFQNMGNADAVNVIIKDSLDSQFDLSTFRLESSSHACSYSIDAATRVVTFSFSNIYLPAEIINEPLSHGYVRYRIKENAGLPIGSVLNNTAYIYFDTNPAVITNTTANVNTSLGIGGENTQANLTIFPQPAGETFYITGIDATQVKSISILDANGKAIVKATNAKINEGIYIGNLANGMYLVNIETNEHTFTQKLCIQH